MHFSKTDILIIYFYTYPEVSSGTFLCFKSYMVTSKGWGDGGLKQKTATQQHLNFVLIASKVSLEMQRGKLFPFAYFFTQCQSKIGFRKYRVILHLFLSLVHPSNARCTFKTKKRMFKPTSFRSHWKLKGCNLDVAAGVRNLLRGSVNEKLITPSLAIPAYSLVD